MLETLHLDKHSKTTVTKPTNSEGALFAQGGGGGGSYKKKEPFDKSHWKGKTCCHKKRDGKDHRACTTIVWPALVVPRPDGMQLKWSQLLPCLRQTPRRPPRCNPGMKILGCSGTEFPLLVASPGFSESVFIGMLLACL
jgi:hypothetical protein